jgi:glycosyltransferase involved in cell wall biosynthesis
LADDAALRRDLGRNGRHYVLENCAKRRVLDHLFGAIGDLSRGSEKRSVLIFEPEPEGHSEEWLRHLIGYAREHEHHSTVWIAVAPELFASLAVELRGAAGDRVRLLPLKKTEAKLCRHRWLTVSSLARWRTARRYAARTRAKAVHFLSIDLLALPLALRFPWGDRSVSGVLFRPSTHYRLLGRYEPTTGERLRDVRKELLYRLMLSRSTLRRVLTIDPYFEAFAGRFYRQGAKVRSVADPADSIRTVSIDSARLAAKFPRARVLFLFFGHLTERKGTLVLLDALRLLPADVASRAAVMLVGKVDPSIDDAVRMKMETLQATRPALLCHLENRRVEYAEIEALTRRADVVLAPYQRFVGSSGVLLWAARLGKPLLTQDFGVLGSLVREYGLGLAVDCTKPFLLADAMTRLVIDGQGKFVDPDAAQEFVAQHTPDNFSRAILASLAA